MSSTDPSTSTEPDTSTSSSTTDSQVLPEETSENIYVDDSVQKLTLGDGTEIEITVDGEHLSCVGQDIQEIPIEFGESYGDTIKYLDLSYNQIKQLTNLDKFTKLDTLCVDNNELISEQVFPELSSLASLSLNNNNIEVLDTLISEVSDKCPNLRMLSLLKNPACPNYFFQKDDDDYNRYRYLVLHQLENLKFLDSSPVSKEELAEAKRVGQFSKVARPVKSSKSNSQPSKGISLFGGGGDKDEEVPDLPQDLRKEGKGSARFGVSRYVYYGRQSEGNRFIMNDDL
eukprot:TRINITY_DN1141_c0_g1_i1.p1 TRINITY_DN1141_c0_g1~~TRINITY_DN1141_c0_g1_i1.p1  ORF type:complete len:286 (+),score=80.61 TRINITY_DN1141_c0_g1_i1:428-1285(+)